MNAGIFEPFYEIVDNLNQGAAQLITGIALAALCRHFMAVPRAKRYAWTVGAVYFTIAALFLYVPIRTWFLTGYDMATLNTLYAFAAYLLSFLAAYLVLYRLEKDNARVWFFLCFTFFTIRWLADSVSHHLSYFVEMRVEEWMMLRSPITTKNIRMMLFLSFCVFRVIGTVLFVLILSGVCRMIERLFFFNRNGMEKKELLLLMIPSISGIICYVWTGRSANVVFEETNLYMGDMDPMYRLMEFVMQVLLLAAIMAMLYLYQKLKQEQGKKQSDALLMQEIKSMRVHIGEVEQLHEDMRGMRHDMRNHISVLQRLLERGESGQAMDYLDSMGRACSGTQEKAGVLETPGTQEKAGVLETPGTQEKAGVLETADTQEKAGVLETPGTQEEAGTQGTVGTPEKNGKRKAIGGHKDCQANDECYKGTGSGNRQTGDIRTGNPVTDVILEEHQRRIAAQKASFEVDFHYPDEAAVDAFDLSIILDNALTNALEAVSAGGVIRIRSFREHHAYLIVVENTFVGELALKGAEGLPMTTKQPAGAHGFGLRHMKAVAEHYHGALTIEQEGALVRLSVMLCI